MFRSIAIFLLTLLLVSCAGKPDFDVRKQPIKYKEIGTLQPPVGDPVIIAVYDFIDLTGQKKPGNNFASMSSAVTQGSYQILIKALQDAGDGKWFRVVERTSLPSLLQERKLIRSTRQQIKGDEAEPLPPLLFAGAYITGGIVGYDSNTKSGGVGARILGLQANKQYRQDIVTIILRLVNVQSGEVVLSITVEKTIFSTGTGADIFKYFDADTLLLETELGVARNEPVTYAIRKAIEKGVVELINEGAKKKVWEITPVPEVKTDEDIQKEHESLKVNQSETKKVKTYEDYLAEKEKAKEKRKQLIQLKIACEKSANASGKVSEECTALQDELDWQEVDEAAEEVKETKEIEENKSDEKVSNGDSDSSSDNN